eukprot:CAMPEP_0115503906 /NCGR_PEP_ID=MMETSP0271-20121206/69731_1 /TAXON_ID=71861 /ORGANISM="Scrippsiella trochoidea, Strain CCMP3099" /LENGTH=66 /DNA_ID=CAMNT_0002933039 /DNA_START=608 /DNA_END=804 /DNA_ORIENTATION=-
MSQNVGGMDCRRMPVSKVPLDVLPVSKVPLDVLAALLLVLEALACCRGDAPSELASPWSPGSPSAA